MSVIEIPGVDESTLARFWSYVDKTETCWLWTGQVSPDGYGRFKTMGRLHGAHRIAYTWFRGEIADGLTIDHVCHGEDCPGGGACLHRRCVNPDHLEAVSIRENTLRSPLTRASQNASRTHCPQGHEYAGDNLYVDRWGKRYCRTCRIERNRLSRCAA